MSSFLWSYSFLRSYSFWGRLLNLLDEKSKFAFYSIKIRLETPEIKILSVALFSQSEKCQCGIAPVLLGKAPACWDINQTRRLIFFYVSNSLLMLSCPGLAWSGLYCSDGSSASICLVYWYLIALWPFTLINFHRRPVSRKW